MTFSFVEKCLRWDGYSIALPPPKMISQLLLNNQKMIFTIKIYSYLLYCVICFTIKAEKYCEKQLHNCYNNVYNVIEGDWID